MHGNRLCNFLSPAPERLHLDQHLGNPEEAGHQGDHVQSALQFPDAKAQSLRSPDRVGADQRKEHAKRSRENSLCQRTPGHVADHCQREEDQGKELMGPELDRDQRERRRPENECDRAKHVTNEGSVQRTHHGSASPALLAHFVPVQQRCGVGSSAGRADQDRGNRTAERAALEESDQERNADQGADEEGKGRKERHAHGCAETPGSRQS